MPGHDQETLKFQVLLGPAILSFSHGCLTCGPLPPWTIQWHREKLGLSLVPSSPLGSVTKIEHTVLSLVGFRLAEHVDFCTRADKTWCDDSVYSGGLRVNNLTKAMRVLGEFKVGHLHARAPRFPSRVLMRACSGCVPGPNLSLLTMTERIIRVSLDTPSCASLPLTILASTL